MINIRCLVLRDRIDVIIESSALSNALDVIWLYLVYILENEHYL